MAGTEVPGIPVRRGCIFFWEFPRPEISHPRRRRQPAMRCAFRRGICAPVDKACEFCASGAALFHAMSAYVAAISNQFPQRTNASDGVKAGFCPSLLAKWMAIPLGRSSPNASRDPPGRRPGNRSPAVPIWSCSRWGLPCRLRCRRRGALLPHRFTLTRQEDGRSVFCGAIPGVAPAGRYPAPYLRGARTFLQPPKRPAAIRPSDARHLYRVQSQGARA